MLACACGVAACCGYTVPFSDLHIIMFLISLNFRRVVAVGLDGTELWVSEQVPGVASGDPVSSGNGAYAFLTHNSDFKTKGHFTILSAGGSVFYTEASTNSSYAPLGIYHNPPEGYYDGGAFNTNDIMVWSLQPKPDDTTVGDGATFAFQFPMDFPASGPGNVTLLGTEIRDFQAITKPVFTNEGRSLYFSHSRSAFTCWIGTAGLQRGYFSRAAAATQGFTRGVPAYQAVWAPPALSSNTAQPFVFGGTAAAEFVKLAYDLSAPVVVTTTSLVQTQAIVAPEDSSVFYVETNGIIHNADFDTVSDIWVYQLGGQVLGQMALKANGSVLYVADVNGVVSALQVTEIPMTEAPSGSPIGVAVPSDSPSSSPITVGETGSPTMAPVTEVPVVTTPAPVAPSTAPVAPPTATTPGSGASPLVWKLAAVVAAGLALFAC
jgi:hypothetical protein